ncbi:hypothetical protein CKO28_14315 [Rhodovibrio sodomensis]|uniref:BRCT domain-containing protein n=1 Tax=Rhodovibrio sodomensis TaxID=1088 RepID=A0ABS1DG27_9PROT|nr:BRCT domain-containing protein [Rhodovibrio sodomensis]MBK1669208.1 hypothetical protein [Rhodovibrio sodomensis]
MLACNVAFTGGVPGVPRSEAARLVREAGGTFHPSVRRDTMLLVCGSRPWPVLPDGSPSLKLSKAAQRGLRIVTDEEFKAAVGFRAPSRACFLDAFWLAVLSGVRRSWIECLRGAGVIEPDASGRYSARDLGTVREIGRMARRGVPVPALLEVLHASGHIARPPRLDLVAFAHLSPGTDAAIQPNMWG